MTQEEKQEATEEKKVTTEKMKGAVAREKAKRKEATTSNETMKGLRAWESRAYSALHNVLTTMSFTEIDEKWQKIHKERIENKYKIILLPTDQGVEEYRERKVKVASYCEYYTLISETKNTKAQNHTDLKIQFRCISLCLVKKLEVHEGDLYADIEPLPEQQIDKGDKTVTDLIKTIQAQFKEYVRHDPKVRVADIERIKNPKSIDNLILNVMLAACLDKLAQLKLLNELDPLKRLQILSSSLETRIFEQSTDKGTDLMTFYKRKIGELVVNADVKKQIYAELNRLDTYKNGPDRAKSIELLDRLLAFPWNIETEDNKDMKLAKKILDSSHYGMDKLKQRILDIIAVRKYATKQPPQILCLYGPPGVGKSTIAKSIAEALGKKFQAISLGGMTDPNELIGMFSAYIGAKPGRIIEAITKVGSNNCVLLLDEIDKIGKESHRGDPSAVLLEILDRNQNSTFKDSYLSIPTDISNVFFITTANELSDISPPLRNRLEILTLDGYSLNEKVHIVNNHILKKIKSEYGIEEDILKLSPETTASIIEQYTFESGVRQLENVIRELCRKVIAQHAIKNVPLKTVELDIKDVNQFIDDFYEEQENKAQEGEVGVVNKLVVTNGNIGKVARLEVVITEGKGEQIISDNIVGTAKATLKTVDGLLQYRAEEWKISKDIFSKNNIHVHKPEHEIRTDGSSGGIADVICILSAIKNIPVPHDIAFTGAITLKGRVLRIGGVKEKILAAQRSGMKTIVLPLANKKDIDKLPKDVSGDLKFKFVNDMTEVHKYIFG